MYLSNNFIPSIDNVRDLPALTDITLENNPVDKIAGFWQIVKDKLPSVQFLNLQKISTMGGGSSALGEEQQLEMNKTNPSMMSDKMITEKQLPNREAS